MKQIVFALMSLVCTSVIATTVEGDSLIYKKSDGEIRLSAVPNNEQQAVFSINTK